MAMNNITKVKIIFLGLFLYIATAGQSSHSYVPKDGYVPNERTAIKIAEAVWEPIYGHENILKKRPFKAVLHDGIWTVVGSLPEDVLGGVPEADIRKDDGRILRVTHGK